MSREAPVTAVQAALRRRRKWFLPLYVLVGIIFLVGIVGTALGIVALTQLFRYKTPHYADIVEHFKYGSIGANNETNGIPYRIWMALPALFPEAFQGRDDYSAFGFLYENDASGKQRDLPIGIARGEIAGVDVVWFNCATCHTGTVTDPLTATRPIVPGMPSDNLDLYAFVRFLLDAAADARLAPDNADPGDREERRQARLGSMTRSIAGTSSPISAKACSLRRSRLLPLLTRQPPWGPGRVDTFNPYKLIQAGIPFDSLDAAELYGAADFPPIFNQRPREGMHLHWDGNNTSLAERNLSAALGAGVTPPRSTAAAMTQSSASPPGSANCIRRRALTRPMPGPWRAGGRSTWAPARAVTATRTRADTSLTASMSARSSRTPGSAPIPDGSIPTPSGSAPISSASSSRAHATPFTPFRKTDGYANLPLDGLWLRGPYLHNGSVPTLADLLAPPDMRPKAFQRGSDVVDRERGGFVSPPCDPHAAPPPGTICFDTSLPGNGNGGHVYGTGLPVSDKQDLLAYLLTF